MAEQSTYTPGQIFDGHYKLVRMLSTAGGSADVWLAIDTNTIDTELDGEPTDESRATRVAIKIYRPKSLLDIEGEWQFRSEFRKVFSCHHEHIVQPTYFSIYEGRPYLVLPYCPAGSSEQMVGRLLEEEELWKYVYEVASGLAYLHEHTPQIIHQDIKPANVLIDDNGNYAITDFGISAELGGSGGAADDSGGTYAYMAPERFAEGAAPMPESDIWAFGATLYELVAGDAPYGNNGGREQRRNAKVPPLKQGIPERIKQLIYDCLAYEPTARPTARAIVEMVLRRRYGRLRRQLALAAAALAIVVAGAVVAFKYFPDDDLRPDAKFELSIDMLFGKWLLASSSASSWTTYQFNQSGTFLVDIKDKAATTTYAGTYFTNDNKVAGQCSHSSIDSIIRVRWEATSATNHEIILKAYEKGAYVGDCVLYKLFSTVEVNRGKGYEPNYRNICGSSKISDFKSVNPKIATVNPKTGRIEGVATGTTFVTFATAHGHAAVCVTVAESSTFAEKVIGLWVYDHPEENVHERFKIMSGGYISSEWRASFGIINLNEAGQGAYNLNESKKTLDFFMPYSGGVMKIHWETTEITSFTWSYRVMSEGTNVGIFTIQRLLQSVRLRPEESATPHYRSLVGDREITGYSVHDASIATVDKTTGKITAVAKGHTYVDVVTAEGAGVVEINVN